MSLCKPLPPSPRRDKRGSRGSEAVFRQWRNQKRRSSVSIQSAPLCATIWEPVTPLAGVWGQSPQRLPSPTFSHSCRNCSQFGHTRFIWRRYTEAVPSTHGKGRCREATESGQLHVRYSSFPNVRVGVSSRRGQLFSPLQQYTDHAAAALVDNFGQHILDLFLGIAGHLGKLVVEALAHHFVQGFSEKVRVPDALGVIFKLG